MVVQQGAFSLEIVDAYDRQKCQEHTGPASLGGGGEVIVQVDPRADHYIRLQVVGGGDPDRVFLFYINVNDVYIRHKQILSGRKGPLDVGLPSYSNSSMHDPIQFQDATLLPKSKTSRLIDEVPFHTNMIHMGKVTVKIYEGVLERPSSAFGNHCSANYYQPGKYVDMISVHCCSTPEDGLAFLAMEDAELLKKACMKRPTLSSDYVDDDSVPSAKKMRTDHGFVAVQNTM